jgi:hypothetical protein
VESTADLNVLPFGRTLKDGSIDACPLQGDGSCQTADPGANNDDATLIRIHYVTTSTKRNRIVVSTDSSRATSEHRLMLHF